VLFTKYRSFDSHSMRQYTSSAIVTTPATGTMGTPSTFTLLAGEANHSSGLRSGRMTTAIALLVYNLYEWLSNDLYGVNHGGSLIYMGAMYVLAIVIYVVARIVRRRQGIDLGLINKEIPVE